VPTWIRYLFFQLPGWIIAATLLIGLYYWGIFSQWVAVLCFSAYVLKDLILYPITRKAYETNVRTGSQALVGNRGVAVEDLSPEGYVRIRGELWRAVSDPADRAISTGTEVEILEANGIMVSVRAVVSNQRR
jgi:membrane protein implicated in regulation of membrane protease activity